LRQIIDVSCKGLVRIVKCGRLVVHLLRERRRELLLLGRAA
jgi:hypothetical protein